MRRTEENVELRKSKKEDDLLLNRPPSSITNNVVRPLVDVLGNGDFNSQKEAA
jgi:hypothetical protein